MVLSHHSDIPLLVSSDSLTPCFSCLTMVTITLWRLSQQMLNQHWKTKFSPYEPEAWWNNTSSPQLHSMPHLCHFLTDDLILGPKQFCTFSTQFRKRKQDMEYMGLFPQSTLQRPGNVNVTEASEIPCVEDRLLDPTSREMSADCGQAY